MRVELASREDGSARSRRTGSGQVALTPRSSSTRTAPHRGGASTAAPRNSRASSTGASTTRTRRRVRTGGSPAPTSTRNIAARAPHGRRWKALSTRSPMPAGTGDHQTGRVADLGAPAGTTSWCTCWCCWTRSTPTGTCPSRGSSTTPGGSQSTSCPDIRTTGRMVTVPSGADFRPRGGGGVRPGRLRIRRVIRAPPSYPAPHRRPHLPARGTRLPRCAGTPDRSAALAAVRAGVHRPLRAARVAGTDRGARGWHHGR